MGVGALAAYGAQADYRGYEATGNAQVDAFYGGMSSAVEKAETNGTDKVLGLTTIPYNDMISYGMSAVYSEASTADDPIIQVRCSYGGENRRYDIHVNEVDPRNASQIEMFALCCYTDDKGITDGGTFGSYSKMKAFGTNAAYNGMFPDLQDAANAGARFDWVAMLEEMAEVYKQNPQTYPQALLADGLAASLDKWAGSHESFYAPIISGGYAADSTPDDPVVEVRVQYKGKTVTKNCHVNGIDPKNATQAEMFAFFYHSDAENGTEDSYRKLMEFAENASRNGYWEQNGTAADIAGKSHNWIKITDKMGEDYTNAGIYSQQKVCGELGWTMTSASLRFVDWESITWVDRSSETFLTPPELPCHTGEAWGAWFDALYRMDFGKLDFDAMGMTENDFTSALTRKLEKRIKELTGTLSEEPSVETLLQAAKDVLRTLDYPLTEQLQAKEEVKAELRVEKELLNSFIGRLEILRSEKRGEQTEPNGSGKEESKSEMADFLELLRAYREEILEKIKNGETEQEFQIGGMSVTIREWNELLEKFDEAEEDLQKEMEDALENLAERKRQAAIKRAVGGTGEDDGETEDDEGVSEALTAEATTGTFPGKEPGEETRYITWYTEEGIFCRREGQTDEYLWTMLFTEDGQYEKVMGLLGQFPSDWNLRFAANEKFWKDYLEERIDTEDFVRHMNEYTDKGKPDYLIEKDGNTYINKDALKYSSYLNSPEGGKMYTPEEFTELMAKEIEDNNRKHIDPDDTEALAKLDETIAKFKRAMLGANYVKRTKHSDYFSANYTWRADNQDGLFRIYKKDDTLFGTFKYEDLTIQKEKETELEKLVSGKKGGADYSELLLDEELKKTLSYILGTKELPKTEI